ncbi:MULTISPECIES: amino acid ABC transporter permease [Enterococcus]|uniref:Amino acid ABC transporter permease n=1 Tax=Enterococcus alishanensis TaxID=1303817 RepID=A0ABS6TDI3_9ENTE|nr:amino acid ABC transporter permease [Enterococcus alishanensis]MBV7390991.1 amino acid ABC transporter permease [Enterococcus alishanensis]
MDFAIIKENIPQYVTAMKITLGLGLAGIVLSIIIGFLIALVRYFKVPLINRLAIMYTELSRNTPLLIQIFFLYYGLPKIGLPIDKNVAAIIGLTFLGAAYMAESFRSSFEYVPKIQIESGKSIGFNQYQLTKEIILPQGLPLAVPSIGANCIFLLKETSVFSAIAIMDLTNTTRDLIGMFYMTREFLFMLVISYAVLILPIVLLIYLLERSVGYENRRV